MRAQTPSLTVIFNIIFKLLATFPHFTLQCASPRKHNSQEKIYFGNQMVCASDNSRIWGPAIFGSIVVVVGILSKAPMRACRLGHIRLNFECSLCYSETLIDVGGTAGKGKTKEHNCLSGNWLWQNVHCRHADEAHER